jgi:hypothetical protein
MKNILLSITFALYSSVILGQGTIDTTTYTYCQIVGTARIMSNKVTIEIDLGQHRPWFAEKRLRDANGDLIIFNGMIDAMNFMARDGWEFVQAYAFSPSGSGPAVYHYLLRKELSFFNSQGMADQK